MFPRSYRFHLIGLFALAVWTGGMATSEADQPAATTAASGSLQPLPTVEEVLESGRDLWGEAAMRRPEGPTYEFFAGLRPPLRYVNAAFRHYPIVLSAPGARHKARFISNGSAINARADLSPHWWEKGIPVTFEVGADGAVFGSDLQKLRGPHYREGWLPIVHLAYEHAGATYEEEAFASTEGSFGEHAAVFVQFDMRDGRPGQVSARVGGEGSLTEIEGTLRDDEQRALVWFDSRWRWDAGRRSLVAALSGGEPANLAVFTEPLASPPPLRLTGKMHESQRDVCGRTWRGLLDRGVRLQVPEPIVNDAWWALVIGTLVLAKDDVLCYSAGNSYERQYEAECGDAVRALLQFGFAEDARRMIVPLLDYKQRGLSFHDAAFKLQLLAHYFWLTRDADFVREQRPRWMREAEVIVQGREAESGLLPPENYCGDIGTQVYTLNSNANAWRGLRDMAAVMEEMGEPDEAERLTSVARPFREKILAALEKSERRDVQPPFIPIALFGAEQPYEMLTATQMGSYWNLMAPYVLGSGVFGDDSPRVQWLLDTLHERGGVCMGMTRFDQHSGLFANEKGVDDLYGLRYVMTLLRRDEVDRALVSFYGKLAQGLTRDTFIGAEGTSLVPLDEGGRPMYLPPNSASNALFLWTLRNLLVQDWDTDDDGKPDTLRLMHATPRPWLENGDEIRAERMPTAFGPVSLTARVRSNLITVEVRPPPLPPARVLLRVRLPRGLRAAVAEIDGTQLPVQDGREVDVSDRRAPFTVRFWTHRDPAIRP